jgi:hypothetical protein
MQTQDDDFPYTSEDPSLAPVEKVNAPLSQDSPQVSDLKAALRLAVGSTLTGRDVLSARLRRMQSLQETIKPESIRIDENETSADQLRYLLLGILFETPDVIERRLKSVDHSSSKVFGFFSKLVSPLTNSWFFSPLKNQYDHAAARGEKVVDRLTMKGRLEEQNSRLMLQQKAIDDLINEVAEYLVLKIKVQEIIEREGTSMAGDVIGEFQEQSADVDSILEDKLKSIFRRNPPPTSDNPPSIPAQGGK